MVLVRCLMMMYEYLCAVQLRVKGSKINLWSS